jgi:predicted HicB family RNase H-like nuclease
MSRVKAVAKSAQYKAEEYSFTVVWSEDDACFIGRVDEFPSLAAHGSTQEKALREIRHVVEYVLEDLAAEKENVPVPLSKRPFSGKLNVRMPKTLHRRLAAESEREGVSLNNWINTKLASTVKVRS